MVSPHFPPDGSAATHRVRLLAPHLRKYGWDPTIVTVDPRDYEGQLDPRLLDLVPADVRVVRCRAWSTAWTRRFGVGDLGLRALNGLRRACIDLLTRERFDALFITIYPSYPAVLGPILKRRFGIPFVLDYQDPWVGEWGNSVGGGPANAVDMKSRLTRQLALLLEPYVVRAADAITAVSSGTYETVKSRYGDATPQRFAAIPLGGDRSDFHWLRTSRRNPHFDPGDGLVHISFVGALLPLGVDLLRAVLRATALLKIRRPDLFDQLRLHFFGTSNQMNGPVTDRVVPIAREVGIATIVTEEPLRVPYLDALKVQADSSALLLIGSRERHYTASRIYPALMTERPIFAVYHESSTAADVLRRAGARVVTISDSADVAEYDEPLFKALCDLISAATFRTSTIDQDLLSEYSAETLAGRLADVLTSLSNDRSR